MSIADDKDTSILGSSYIQAEGTNSHERLEAPDDRCMARGSVCCLCTYNESIHRTVTLQFLSSAPRWLKFLPFVTVHDIKCHPNEAWSSNWQCRQGFGRSCSVPWSQLLRTTFPGPPLLKLHPCCSHCSSSPFPSLIFWWLLAPSQRQMIFSHCLSKESDRKQHLCVGSFASSLTSCKGFLFLLEKLQILSAPAIYLQ